MMEDICQVYRRIGDSEELLASDMYISDATIFVEAWMLRNYMDETSSLEIRRQPIDYGIYGKRREDEPKGEWIPCAERLPSEKKAVLICDSGGNRFVGKLVLTDHGYKWSVPLFTVWVDIEDGDVWMPLPKPYKERSEE